MSYIKKKRKVSVAMAIYNCENTLREAIDSIITQSFTDWEMIMCDDGSSDGTLGLAKEYEQQYENILVIQNPQNLGLPASLNHCIEFAQGEYIARMDGDDISLTERFQKEVDFLDAHPEYAIVSCEMIHFDETGDWGISRYVEKPEKMDFLKKSPFCHAGSMMRKNALNAVGNYTVSKELRRGQDYWLWHKFYCAGYKGYNLQVPLYKMRDGRDATRRRTWLGAVNSTKAELKIFRNLGLPWYLRMKAFRSLFVAMLPAPVYSFLHKKKQKA